MTDTHFATGAATAYVTDHVIALSNRPVVDADVMALCASGDWNVLSAAAAEHDLSAVVVHHDDHVRLGVSAGATVEVATGDGDLRFGGDDVWTTQIVDRVHHVTLMSTTHPSSEPTYRVDGGAVPASVVSRRLGAPVEAPADPFEILFGHTVARSVEDAAVRPNEGAPAPTAALGVLVFSTGERVVVDTDIVLGRNPRPADEASDPRPRLVKVSHPGVSRQHAMIRLERWSATIEDLGSANGTTVAQPGRAPMLLERGTPLELDVGAAVDLGGHVSFSVEAAA